ncbi:MAG: GEVED domain-containing protein, partial [Bacteroidia bacterium]
MIKDNYLIKGLMSVLLISAAGWANAQTYCQSAARYTADSKCDRVELVGNTVTIDENSSSAGCQVYTDNTSVAAADLSPGGNYTVTITQGTCRGNYTRRSNAWIDFNGDGDFTDAGEMLSTGNGSGVNVINFTVPCSISTGTTRMRVIVNESGATLTNPCLNNYNWGETEDYTVNLLAPAGGLSSNFFIADTSFVGTPVRFVNSNQSGYISHNWTIDGVPYTSTNVTRVFNTTGTYTAKLVSENCLGKDSTTKTFTIVTPTAPPVANFVSDKNAVEIFETFSLVDLSSNGPTYWDWSIIKGTDTIDGDDQPNLRGNNPYTNKNPLVNTGNYFGAVDVGTWEVCLKATNVIGSSTKFCKTSYITVERTSFNMGPATSLPANIITASGGV